MLVKKNDSKKVSLKFYGENSYKHKFDWRWGGQSWKKWGRQALLEAINDLTKKKAINDKSKMLKCI